jgi:hypothetical protein
MLRIATVGISLLLLAVCGAGTAQAAGESLNLGVSDEGHEEPGKALTISAEGVADGTHRLFAFVQAGTAACAATPMKEWLEVPSPPEISPGEGSGLLAGSFERFYPWTPGNEAVHTVCAYLAEHFESVPDVIAQREFGGGPVGAGELSEQAKEELKRIALQHEREREEEKAAKERAERELAEKLNPPIATGTLHGPEPLPLSSGAGAVRCVVPGLRGRSLASTRRMLRAAHCSLGKVGRVHGSHGALVVLRQGTRRGTHLHDGAAVAVTLGSAPRHS